MSDANQLGTPVNSLVKHFVQISTASLDAWSDFTIANPRASSVLIRMIKLMGHQNAVIVSQETLANLCKCSMRTISRAIDDLEKGKWIQVITVGKKGTVKAYVVNSAVAWGEKRDNMRLSVFHANVIADAGDQPYDVMAYEPLRQLPIVIPPEVAIPYGDGEPGSQIPLPGMEPVIEGKR